jgi:peptide/nickel transport system ATP-binding protein
VTTETVSPSAKAGNGTTPLLTVEGLTTWFPTERGALHAVDDVSFSVARGETLGIVGESGSGKSVLVRTIMGLTPRTAETTGRVDFDGRDLRRLDEAEGRKVWGSEIAMVFQDPATSLNPVHRIGRQITEALELHLDLRGEAARARAVELLGQVGIAEPERRLRSYPHELSGGMRQRVCIAIAISCSPQLLFADEPTTALDVTVQRQILDLLASLQDRYGMAMVLISHDLGVVARHARRAMVMYGGQVVESGLSSTLFRSTRHPYTAALLGSIPRLSAPSHTPLAVIPGRPVDVVDPTPGCRFAPRCRYARPRCTTEDPPLVAGTEPGHVYACFHPVGTPEGESALQANLAAESDGADADLDASSGPMV